MIWDISASLAEAEPVSDTLIKISRLLHDIADDPQFAQIVEY